MPFQWNILEAPDLLEGPQEGYNNPFLDLMTRKEAGWMFLLEMLPMPWTLQQIQSSSFISFLSCMPEDSLQIRSRRLWTFLRSVNPNASCVSECPNVQGHAVLPFPHR